MAHRSIPITVTGVCPAELLMGRKTKTILSSHLNKLKPKWPSFREVKEKYGSYKTRRKINYDERHVGKDLKALKVGDKIQEKTEEEKTLEKSLLEISKTGHTQSSSTLVNSRKGIGNIYGQFMEKKAFSKKERKENFKMRVQDQDLKRTVNTKTKILERLNKGVECISKQLLIIIRIKGYAPCFCFVTTPSSGVNRVVKIKLLNDHHVFSRRLLYPDIAGPFKRRCPDKKYAHK